MSIERCDRHDRHYDTDFVEQCPLCLDKEVSAELRKEFKPIYCKECSELWEDCLCPKHEQPELCPEPWMRRV